MDKKPNHPRTGKADLQSAKRVVLTLAVTSTLGFWALFSRLNQNSTSSSTDTSQVSDALPQAQVENRVVLQLPPMPTLVPALESSLAAASTTIQPPVNIAASLPATGKLFLGGSKPDTAPGAPARRVPVTRTRSS